MAKPVTAWKTRSGYDTATADNAGFSLLLEDGFNLLLETGSELLLEDTVISHKNPSEWSTPAKVRSSWAERDGYSSVVIGTGDDRITEQGDLRITEQGDQRISELVTFTKKPVTEWSE